MRRMACLSAASLSLLIALLATSGFKLCDDKCPPIKVPCGASGAVLNACNITPAFTPEVTIRVDYGATVARSKAPLHMVRTIITNGIPNHAIGEFGTQRVTPCGRPTQLAVQSKTYKLPVNPTITDAGPKKHVFFTVPTVFGVALNGVPFDPEAAEWYRCNEETGWQKSALNHPDMATDLDCNNGHIQPDGAYHYHGLPVGLYTGEGGVYPIPSVSSAGGLAGAMPLNLKTVLLGWGADGVPAYGPLCYRLSGSGITSGPNWWQPRSGYALKAKPMSSPPYCEPSDAYMGYYDEDYEYVGTAQTLDECNGHFGPTPEEPGGVYHYHITEEYPHIPRCWTAME